MSNNNNNNNNSLSIWVIFIVSVCVFYPQSTTALHGGGKVGGGGSVPVPVAGTHGTVVRQDQRWVAVSTEFGEIAVVKVSDGKDGFYDLRFITMEPNSLFVPVLLHSDMVFYVNSGSGTLNWVDLQKDKKKLRQVDLRTGDVYRLRTGSFFYLQSNLESERRKFRITAIFSDSKEEIRVCIQTSNSMLKHHTYKIYVSMQEGSSFGPYSSVGDLLFGFDNKVLQAALNVNEVVLQELRSGGRQQMIVHGVSTANEMFEMHYRSMRAFLGIMGNGLIELNKNKKGKAFNILEAKHDFENCNGWSLVVTSKQMDALKDSDFGIFLVNLTKGSMMGPHWNPMTAEIAVVLEGSGMVHVVCPSTVDEAECKNLRFRVEEGDVFVVPRYHPMAQISFNNGSFIFLGFTTTQKNNHPQYLVGSASVFQVLDKGVLAASLGVSNTTMDEMLSAQSDAIILECTSCAEEEERLMKEEIQREKEEEAKEREEEEREREAEEEARRQEEARREQEEAQKRAEEEAKREQEEARKREEEIARREQEEQEAKRRQEEEEAARKQEEAEREQEEARKREEEAARREQEEQEAKRRWEEEEAARQKEAEEREREEARRREEEAARREEEAKRRQQEEEAARQQEEAVERWRQQEEEAATRRRHQEEEAAEEQEQKAERRRQEEEELARQRQEQEEAARRQQEQEAAARRQQEQEAAARRQQEQKAAARRQQEQEAAARKQEETIRRQQEEEAARQQEAARKQQEEEAARQQEEAMRRQQEEAASRQQEAAMKRKHEEEAARQQEAAMRQKHIEEAARQQEEGRGYEEETVTRWGGGEGSEHQHEAQGEGEAAMKKEQEMAQRARKADEEAARREAGGGFKTGVQNQRRL
ncbi:uncharacterized protein LOC143590339 [Bidens hawaiensis]|uniref:uncharacterized protein LOC143590339 n=1 Tax=Bidens hawaiensis TaxID=980011 RepID=UPI00404B6626